MNEYLTRTCTDTDSIFTQSDVSGKQFEYSDGEHSIPVILDVKGKGDLVYFRAKNYILNEKVYGRHGWQYFYEDYLQMYNGTVTTLQTRRDIKHTLDTREKQTLKLEVGRWLSKPVTLDLNKLKYLLKADRKRKRITYDSYELVMSHKSAPSQALDYEEINALLVGALDNALA